jgi:hypothetical protein
LALLATLGLQLAALLIWGATLSARVKALEEELAPFKTLSTQVARVEARLEGLVEQFRDLNAVLRWRRVAASEAPSD